MITIVEPTNALLDIQKGEQFCELVFVDGAADSRHIGDQTTSCFQQTCQLDFLNRSEIIGLIISGVATQEFPGETC